MNRPDQIKIPAFICGQEEFLEATVMLADQSIIEPRLIINGSSNAPIAHAQISRFPSCERFSGLDLIAGRGLTGKNIDSAVCLDADTLSRYAWCERHTLKMADRLGGMSAVPYAMRIRHYHRLLAFWLKKIEFHQPRLVVFSGIPHLMYDYVLYAVCQEHGIKTRIFEKTSVPGLIYSVGKISETLSARAPFDNQALSPKSQPRLDVLKAMRVPAGAGQLVHMKYLQKTRGNVLRRKAKAIRQLFRLAFVGLDGGYESVSGYLPEQRNHASRWRVLAESLSRSIKRRRIIQHFQRLTTIPDYSSPYILLALQCEPEKSTAPLSGEYCHQILFVRALAAALPAGWRLYVKEHISQFIGLNAIDKTKHNWFYDDIIAVPNVQLLDPKTDTKKLIDHAKAVAVTSGTIGFEAVARGTPVLEAGVNWFSGCPGVHRVNSASEIAHAIKLVSIESIDPGAVDAFLAHIERLGTAGYVDRHYREPSGVPRSVCAENIANEIKRFL